MKKSSSILKKAEKGKSKKKKKRQKEKTIEKRKKKNSLEVKKIEELDNHRRWLGCVG